MANANLAQRTFSKTFLLPTSGSLTVSCVDSAGNLLKCNYLVGQFGASANASTGAITYISPVVGASISHPSSIGASLSSTNSTSGSLGFALMSDGIFESPIYEYICLPNESFSLINLYNIGAFGGAVTLTYGLVAPISPVRITDREKYSRGL